MQNYAFFVGLDISKYNFSVCIKNNRKETIIQKTFTQTKQGFTSFLTLLCSYSEPQNCIVGMESTGVYHIPLLSFLKEHNIKTTLINPSLIQKFSKLNLRPSKSDKKDAETIARFLIYSSPNPENTSHHLAEIKTLAREKERIAKEISHIKDRIKKTLFMLFPELETKYNIFTKTMLNFLLEFPSAYAIKSVSRRIVYRKIAKILMNQRGRKQYPLDIVELAQNSIGINSESAEGVLITYIHKLLLLQEENKKFSKILNEKTREIQGREKEIISSIPGIGESLAVYFLAEIGDIRRFESAKKVIADAGIDPIVKQSGRYEGHFQISKRGNRHIRRTLYLMVLNMIRFNGKFRDYFETHRARGRSFKSAVIATANKLIRIIYSMLIHNRSYEENLCHSS